MEFPGSTKSLGASGGDEQQSKQGDHFVQVKDPTFKI